MAIEYPLTLWEGYDLFVIDNYDALQVEVELIDAEDMVYEGYDASGNRVDIVAEGNNIVPRISTDPRDRKNELRERLLRYLGHYGDDIADNPNASIEELISAAKIHR